MQTLIVICNLGRVRAVKLHPAGDDPQDKIHLFEEPGLTVESRPDSIHEVVTDSAGRFSQGGPLDRKSGMSYGEGHHLEDELQNQALKRIAGAIDRIVSTEGCPTWRLVAPQPILPALQEALSATTRQALSHSEGGDWTRLPLAELEERLLHPH